MAFQDHFSGHAAEYAAYRPTYPPALFRYLAGLAAPCNLAWDCATGNGQAALGLARYFPQVMATDASRRQLESAASHPRVRYVVASAEKTTLETGSVDLVTVAQALHWFDVESFHVEARRVLRRGGVLAVWCYGLSTVGEAIDPHLKAFHEETIGPFWPLERRHIEERYESLPFPYEAVETPGFEMRLDWTVETFLAYLRTWSAVKRYQAERGVDPVVGLERVLRPLWGSDRRRVRWPLTVKAGRSI